MNSLPDELMVNILNFVGSDDFLANLALSMTNQRFHRLAIERLYNRFPGVAPNKFLRTIALPPPHGRPALAECVEEVVWTYDCDKNFSTHDITPECRKLLANSLGKKELNLAPQQIFEDLPYEFLHFGLEGVNCVWYLEFFLFFVPKVKRLVVNCPEWNSKIYWFETVALNPACFKHLRSVLIHGPVCLENITPLLNLPSLRNLELTKVRPSRETDVLIDGWEANPYAVDSDSAEKYQLEHFSLLGRPQISPFVLFQYFKAFKSLRSFTCDNVKSFQPVSPFDYLSLRPYFYAQRTSLEKVVFHKENASFFDLQLLLKAIDCLKNLDTLDICAFEADKNYHHDLIVPIDFASLPSSITTLRFNVSHSDDPHSNVCQCFIILEHTAQFLRLLVSRVKPAMPSLQTLAVTNWPSQLGIYPSDYVALQKSFAAIGVNFVSTSTELARLGPLKFRELDGEDEGWLLVLIDTYMTPCGEGKLYYSDKF